MTSKKNKVNRQKEIDFAAVVLVLLIYGTVVFLDDVCYCPRQVRFWPFLLYTTTFEYILVLGSMKQWCSSTGHIMETSDECAKRVIKCTNTKFHNQ